MTTLLALALAYSGLTALCLAMDKHHRQVLGRSPAPPTTAALRSSGVLLLALALLYCSATFPGSLGLVVWLGVLTAAAIPLVFLLPYAPRFAAVAAACAPVVAAAAAFALA